MKRQLFWAIPFFLLIGIAHGCARMDIYGADSAKARHTQTQVPSQKGPEAPKTIEKNIGDSQPSSTGQHENPLAGPSDDELTALIAERASKELGRSIDVTITHQKRVDDWTYIVGAPREMNGAPVDYGSTRYAAQSAEGMVDDVLMALVRRSVHRWELVEFSLGATDAPFFDWSDKYSLPLSLFAEEGD